MLESQFLELKKSPLFLVCISDHSFKVILFLKLPSTEDTDRRRPNNNAWQVMTHDAICRGILGWRNAIQKSQTKW